MFRFLHVMKYKIDRTVSSVESRDPTSQPHHNQLTKPLNQGNCMQDIAQLKCDSGAGRHTAVKNQGHLKMSCNPVLIDSKWKMTQGNSGATCWKL